MLRWLTYRATFSLFISRSLASIHVHSHFSNVGQQMKQLNDQHKFRETIVLFQEYIKSNNTSKSWSSMIITQALKACIHHRDQQQALNIHHAVSNRSQTDPFILSSLIEVHMHWGDTKRAEELFEKGTNRDLYVYGAMMKGYITNKMPEKAVKLFQEIKNPPGPVFTFFFNACAALRSKDTLVLMKSVLPTIPEKILMDPRLQTTVIDALMKCGDVHGAEILYDRIEVKSIQLQGAMMKGYISNDLGAKAIEFFRKVIAPNEVIVILLFNACARMKTTDAHAIVNKVYSTLLPRFKSNPLLICSLIDAFMKCGDIESAERVFHDCKTEYLPIYGAMMKGYLVNDDDHQAVQMYRELDKKQLLVTKNTEKRWICLDPTIRDEIRHHTIIYIFAINAAARQADPELCELLLKKIPTRSFMYREIESSLVDMWGKSGYPDRAKKIFDAIDVPNHVAHTAMINAYGLNGMGEEAIELFSRMPKNLINDFTYVCVLNACSHAGLVEKGLFIFNQIKTKSERIFATMIDCLSRASHFDEAQQLIDQYEKDHPPNQVMHMALLSGLRTHRQQERTEQVHARMKNIFPKKDDVQVAAAVLLANTYSSLGESQKSSDIKIELHRAGLKKKAGESWTTVDGQYYRFKAHDRSHPQSVEIYAELDRISSELVAHGHAYDPSWITRPLQEDETVESVLCGHSERLAIAWNFVANPKSTRIHIGQSLRVCGDCRKCDDENGATKLIARIRQCEIIVSDANRIHHFGIDGRCSCNDVF